MQGEIENYKSNEVNLNVSEDISILYIVQHELLNQKEVEFAGVVLKHQLKEDFSFRIVTKKSKPLDILHKALQSSSDNASKIKEMIESEINKDKSAGSA
jgi:DNA-directed RNA polymerase subunit L